MDDIKCDLCGVINFNILFNGSSLRSLAESDFSVMGELGECPPLVQCVSCGLIFANPRDADAELRNKYENLRIHGYLLEESSRRVTADKDVLLVRSYLEKGRFLDVGCSVGLFLDTLGTKFERYGIELGRDGARQAAALFGTERIFQGRFEDACYPEKYFSGISFWDVLEHLTSPSQAIKRSADLLVDNGYVFAVVPDIGSLTARLMGHKWPHLIRSHLFYFSRKTLTRLFKIAGFEIVSISTYVRYFTVRYLFERIGLLKPQTGGNEWRGCILPINTFDSLLIVGRKR